MTYYEKLRANLAILETWAMDCEPDDGLTRDKLHQAARNVRELGTAYGPDDARATAIEMEHSDSMRFHGASYTASEVAACAHTFRALADKLHELGEWSPK